MAVSVTFESPDDVARAIDGLLEAAAVHEADRPSLSRAYVALADRIGDALDGLPYPSGFRANVEAQRARHAAAMQQQVLAS